MHDPPITLDRYVACLNLRSFFGARSSKGSLKFTYQGWMAAGNAKFDVVSRLSGIGGLDFFLESGRWKHTIDDLSDSVSPFSNILLEG